MEAYGVSTVTTSYQNLKIEDQTENNKQTNDEITKAFYKFIKEFKDGNVFKYRDQLTANIQKNFNGLIVDFEDIDSENKNLAEYLVKQPGQILYLLENSIKEVVYEIKNTNDSKDLIPNYQFILNSKQNPMSLREINSGTIHQLIVVNGIIISATKSSIKMNKCTVQCKNCGNLKTIEVKSGFSNISIPRQCDSAKLPTENKEKCPLDSYHIVPEKSTYIDSQILKIQEPPETIPVGEIPRSYLIYCDRNLVNKVTPGTRVTVIGIQCVDERNLNRNSTSDKNSYIKVLNFQTEEQKSGRQRITFTQEDELKFQQLAKDKKIYEKISRSIAPAIYGMEDIKKSIACLLFGGCRKRMNEGVNLRGDINILLLGDPSTAKSQFLKFVERVAPVAVYTSGKGSSAAGLTASIIKDPSSGEFQLEGGAMVLADGGIVCIDEFDKMRAQDRVAIHEAMEQQTISVAKAGITTTLNSRTSVLAAANPIYGHIDELKSTQEQIDFQTTILSRFDCIFLVKDEHNEDKDIKLASHIVDISAAGKSNEQTEEGEIPIEELKKFIAYARMKVVPKLTEESGEFLKNYYVKDRKDYFEKKNKKGNDIPVTVRQLEAIIRLSEAIAKMSLSSTVTKNNVIEAHRLFQVSTLSAAGSNKIYRIPNEENAKEMLRIEEAIKRRLGIGQRIQTQRIIEELLSKFNSQNLIQNAIINLINNGSLKYHNEKKILTRKK